jgi:endonuclease/exonuclease/phosphatase family metal-dependent hydrolase
MRIVSYNILTGGEGRADPLCEVLLAQRADVIGLVEAEDATVLERLARRLNMDYVQAVGNRSGASALLSRFPIRDTVNHAPLQPGLSKSLLQATVVDAGGREWSFGVVHLHARATEEDERKREAELDVVLKAFEPMRARRQPHFLIGDFNATSPVQQIDLAKCKPSTREQAAANGGAIPRRVVQRILNDGYADTYYLANPADAATRGTFTTQFPGQRVDYVFAHSLPSGVGVRSAWIEYDRLATYASDHYPVGVEVG